MKTLSHLLSIVLVSSCVTAATTAQELQTALPKGVERVTTVEGITEYRLSNGLRVLLFPDQSQQTATFNITYRVGSSHENYGETGMAHLLEHLTFKGSTNHPNIDEELSTHGGQANGTTWVDRTNYYITLPASDANIDWVIKLEADRMVNSFISKKSLDSEMTVVRNEFEIAENRADQVLIKRVRAAAHKWHNYGKDTLGTRSDIENVPIDRLQAFYRRYYQPDNAVVLLAGKFEPAKTLALVSEAFGRIPRPSRELTTFYTVEPAQDGEQTVTVRRVGAERIIVTAYHIPAAAHPDKAAIDLFLQVINHGVEGHLYKALVEAKKATSVQNWSYIRRDPDLAVFQADTHKEDSLEAARDTLVKTVEEFAKHPPTPEEVESARRYLLKGYELNSPDRTAISMSEWIGAGDWRLFFVQRDRIKKVSLADLQRVAAAYFRESNRTVGMFIGGDRNDRVDIPAVPDVAALVKDYKGEAAVAEGEAFDPTPINIEQRVTRKKLPVGLKVAMLPKRTRGNTVHVEMIIRFGDEKSLAGRSIASTFTSLLMMQGGTSKHTSQQIADSLGKLKSRVMLSPAGAGAMRASIDTTRENLSETLTIAAEMLRDPAFPQPMFEQFKRQFEAVFQAQLNMPESTAYISLLRHLNPYPKTDVRYIASLEEAVELVKAVSLDDVKNLHAEFLSASNADAALVGDFDPAETEKMLSDLFGSWKSTRLYARVSKAYKEVPPANQSIETPDKTNAYITAGLNLNIGDQDPDYPAMILVDYIFGGGGFLNSRLSKRIRQKEGFSYDVNSSFSVNPLDQSGYFRVAATFAPQNAAKIETALKEEFEAALKEGFTKEEVEAAKTGILQDYRVRMSNDASLAGMLVNYLFLNRTLNWEGDLEKRIAALTPDQVTAAMRKHVIPSKISVVKAGDFAKAKAN